jgi:hypothetical protein
MAATTATRSRASRNSGTDWLRSQAKRVSDGGDLPVTTDVAATVEVEAWLQRYGVRYAPPAQIPMGLIDERRSRANQARRDPIVADSVDRFVAAMRAGSQFPPIVVYADAGKLIIIDGNNRQAAARRAGYDSIFGIQIADDTPSELIHLLTVAANANHGVTPEIAWRVHQAFGLCAIGWSDADAATAAGLSVTQLRSARSIQETDQRARALRIPGFSEMPASSKTALAAVKDDAVFHALAKLAVSTGMTSDEIRDVTRVLRGLTSEGARIEYVGSIAKTRNIQRATKRAGGQHSRLHSPKTALAASIGKLVAIDPSALVRQVVTTHDRDVIRHRIGQARQKLDLIEDAMTRLSNLGAE